METNIFDYNLHRTYKGNTNLVRSPVETLSLEYLKLGVMKEAFLWAQDGEEVGGNRVYWLNPGEELHFWNLKQVNYDSSLCNAMSISNFMFVFVQSECSLEKTEFLEKQMCKIFYKLLN